MANLALVLCVFVLPAVSLCQNEGAAPVFNSTTNSSVVYGEIGQTVTLFCQTTNGSDIIAWYLNNVPMLSETQGTLTLSDLQMDSGGWYTCAAANRFGRAERDFLVVVGRSPVEVVTFNNTVYSVPVGYYAELPCHFVGSPHPTIQWFDGKGGKIVNAENRYEINRTTGSLMVHNSNREPEKLHFYCNATNVFNTTLSNNITVEFFSVGSLSQPISFPLLNSTNHSLPLTCTNLTNPMDSNYNVTWTRNLNPATEMNANTQPVTESGYYCCQISSLELTKSYFCTTVVVNTAAYPQLDSINAVNVSLPSNKNRRVNLLCKGSTSSGYDSPLIEWFDGQDNQLRSTNDLRVVVYAGLGYLSTSGANQSTLSTSTYTCRGNNTAGADSTSAVVQYIATCSGNDWLKGGNAEVSTEVNDSWTFNGAGASVTSVNNENVFMLEYNGTGTPPSIVQTLTMPSTLTSINISGRMRQVGPGVATIRVLIDDLDQDLDNPYPTLPSWQWVGFQLKKTGMNLTVQVMMILNDSSSATTAYFDDLCVTFSNTVDPENRGLNTDIIAISVGAACGVLLLLIVAVFLCSCCCYCCCGKKKGDARMMKKMGTLIKKKHSAVIKELKGTEGRYAAQPGTQNAAESQVELYVVADPDPEAYYVNPENYASTADGQHSTRIPSVVVERSVKSSSASQENGIYTSLKPGTLDKDNVYQAPASHPSSTSLQNLVSDNEQYVEVEPGSAAAKYMQLLASDVERVGRTSSTGSRSRSPCPEFPPPKPPSDKQQVYDNSPGVAIPSVSSSGAFRRISTDGGHMHSRSASQLASPTSLQSGEDDQIYENSQEIVPSSVPLFSAGSLPRTSGSTNGMRSFSPRSPPIHVPAPQLLDDDDEQQIYENSEEVVMGGEEEEDIDDIYENDIPGMNQQSPNSKPITS